MKMPYFTYGRKIINMVSPLLGFIRAILYMVRVNYVDKIIVFVFIGSHFGRKDVSCIGTGIVIRP